MQDHLVNLQVEVQGHTILLFRVWPQNRKVNLHLHQQSLYDSVLEDSRRDQNFQSIQRTLAQSAHPMFLTSVCFNNLLSTSLYSFLPSKGMVFKDLNSFRPSFFLFPKPFIFTLSLALSSLCLFSTIRELFTESPQIIFLVSGTCRQGESLGPDSILQYIWE